MPPTMMAVIDTEEEFDWRGPFSREARSTRNLGELWRIQEIFDRHGVVPLYVVDHPVLDDIEAVRWLSSVRDRGGCEIGAHLHPWVTPPYEEEISLCNSFSCNLPPHLERRKIRALTAAIEMAFGTPPTAFRSGRYGVGPSTFDSLVDCGYRTDLSLAPHSSFKDQGGPSFYGWNNRPFWTDHTRQLLGFPVTTGFSGSLRAIGPHLAPMLDSPLARRLHLPGMLAWGRFLDRDRLTPEGTEIHAMIRLLDALVRDGERIVTMSLHSSALLPGATAYTRDEGEREAFLMRLDAILAHFANTLGGVFASCSATDAAIRAA